MPVFEFIDQLGGETEQEAIIQEFDLDDALGHGLKSVKFTGTEVIGIDPNDGEVPLA